LPDCVSWKTTMTGALLAGATALATYQANGGSLNDWKLYVVPVLVAVLGYFSKDHNTPAAP